MRSIPAIVRDVDPIAGWLRPEQAARLWEIAGAVGEDATIVEIGSFRAKSTVVIASAAPEGALVYAIDPHAGNDRGPGEWHGDAADGLADHAAFEANLRAHGVRDRVVHVREFSQQAQAHVPGEVAFLYVDGAHGYAAASSDIVDWGGRVRDGGSMAIHDTYTSVFVTMAVARSLWFSRSWRYVGRERSMSFYEKAPVRGPARITNAARQLANVPWFLKNCVVRGLDLVGLHRLSRLGQGPGGGVY